MFKKIFLFFAKKKFILKTTCNCTLWRNFLGQSPDWYKLVLIFFLFLNPLVFSINPFISGWLLVAEFIFTLAMALKCYPLLPGGLLALEAIIIGMTNAEHVRGEIANNLDVLLLLIFMVAGIHFMKQQLLLFIFTRLLLNIHSKTLLSLAFCSAAAFLSAFLDALTVMAVIISVAMGFYGIYHQVFSSKNSNDTQEDSLVDEDRREVLEQFRSFLRSLMMHAGVGTAFGGVMTMVGEPQNLIIAKSAGWNFGEFFIRTAPVSIPVFFCGLFTCYLVEKFQWFDYGAQLPDSVYDVLYEYDRKNRNQRNQQDRFRLIIQGIIAFWLIIALALHLAEVGLIGLSIIILVTSFTGIIDEHTIGKSFTESLPFTALLSVFFSIVAVIIDQQLFAPIIKFVLQATPDIQLTLFYLFNALLSSISDNVFVGTVYINEAKSALMQGIISVQQFKYLVVAINTGTNLPSVATPNGQAAFLFLLTSTLSPLIRLSYRKMIWMTLPYTMVLTIVGLLCIKMILIPYTHWLMQIGILETH